MKLIEEEEITVRKEDREVRVRRRRPIVELGGMEGRVKQIKKIYD